MDFAKELELARRRAEHRERCIAAPAGEEDATWLLHKLQLEILEAVYLGGNYVGCTWSVTPSARPALLRVVQQVAEQLRPHTRDVQLSVSPMDHLHLHIYLD